MSRLVYVIIGLLALYCQSAFTSQYHTINTLNLKKVFDSVKPYGDLSSAYYSIKGLKLLGETITNAAEVCTFVKSKLDQNNIESVFFASGIANDIGNCPLGIQNFQEILKKASTSQNVADLYYYSNLAKDSKLAVDVAQLTKSLIDGLKRDTSIINQAYSLHISLDLPETEKTFYNNIEDILEQADEVDNTYLQYEGGVATTSFVLDGILRLSEKFKNLPNKFTRERLTKFINYLSSKRYTSNVKSAYNLLSVALRLTNNQFVVPVIVNRISPISVTQDRPNALISVTNLIGRPVGKDVQFNIETESAVNQQANQPVLFNDKRQFTAKSSDNTAFELKLYDAKTSTQTGFFTITINVTPKVADKRLLILNNKFEVKFQRDLEITELQIGAADREQSTPKLNKLTPGTKLTEKLNGDVNSKVYVKFGLKDKSNGNLVEANQVFVKFTNQNNQREIIFLAEQNTATKQYNADVDLSSYSKSFNNLNGIYSIELVVSDSLVKQALQVPLADIKLQFNDASSSESSDNKANLYAKKPEIKHIFRVADPTPSPLISTAFSALVLLPLLILIVFWFNIGFNFSKFQFSLSAIVFHVSLATIFGLLYCYWAYLNMFVTLRYLALLAIVAFLSGKSVLSGLAAQKEKTN